MADTGIFATTAEIGYKAGYGKSAVSSAEAYTNNFIAQAESEINCICRWNFSDTYGALNADVKQLLKEAASNLAAIYVVNYDYRGYMSRTEAEDIINVLRDNYLRCVGILREQVVKDFINGA
jgi:hypothetical protein